MIINTYYIEILISDRIQWHEL